MARKVTQIKYMPLAKKIEFSHSDGSKTTYVKPTIPTRLRLEWLPYNYLTSFVVVANEINIYIHKEKIKINWQ
jgi:hypothetical protein